MIRQPVTDTELEYVVLAAENRYSIDRELARRLVDELTELRAAVFTLSTRNARAVTGMLSFRERIGGQPGVASMVDLLDIWLEHLAPNATTPPAKTDGAVSSEELSGGQP